MTDAYQPSVDDVVGFIHSQRQQAISRAAPAADENPDDAARALDLSHATGLNPALVYGNLDTIDQQFRTQLTSELLNNNPHLQDYANSHPLASRISSDDWGNLDTASQSISKLNTDSFLTRTINAWNSWRASLRTRSMETLASRYQTGTEMTKAFAQGFGPEGPGSWLDRPSKEEELGTPVGRVQAVVRDVATILGAPLELGFRTFTGATDAVMEGYRQTLVQHGMSEENAMRSANDMNMMIQLALMHGEGMAGTPHVPPELNAIAEQARGIARAAKPYLDANVEPPLGTHPVLDQLKAEQTKIDVDNIDEALKDAQSSLTRERNPDMFANFVRQHTDAEIGISSEAVRRLYGDTVPMPDDGLLGFVPDIEDQLIGTEPTGGDIHIPLADWLAKVDPKVAKDLRDDTRVRPGGLTLAEAKELEPIDLAQPQISAMAEPDPLDHVDDVRRQGGMVVGDRLVLQKISQGTGRFANVHDYDFVNREGQRVGDIQLTYDDAKKDLYVEYVRHDEGPQALGPRQVRDLMRQIKAEFPEAKTISGVRVSGAREREFFRDQPKDEEGLPTQPYFEGEHVSIPIKADLTGESARHFADMIRQKAFDTGIGADGGRWLRIGPPEQDYWLKPKKSWTDNERQVVQGVHDALQKLVPRMVRALPVERIEMAGAEARASYIPFRDTLPYIVWTMDETKDPIGQVRHEAIHHLRQYGFFTPDEWRTLQKAAIEQKWLDKYDIRERYRGLGPASQLEEAIAEGFKDWHRRNWDESLGRFRLADSPFERLMQKIGRLYNTVRRVVREAFGKTPDWKDLFEKVEAGEIGARTGVKPLHPGVFRHPLAQRPEQPELPGITRIGDRDLFKKASAVGMTVKSYKQILEQMRQRDAEDMEWAKRQNEKEITQRQTAEWKAAEKKLREEIKPDFENRPDLAADKFMREGTLYGEKTRGKPKINGKYLTAEQKAGLPREYLAEHGLHPDDVGALFGFHSGDELVESLAKLHADRTTMGLKPQAFVNKLLDTEVERRMKLEHGDLAQNILDETQDHAISQTQFDMLHEETLAAADRAGMEMSLTKEDMQRLAQDNFARLKVGAADVVEHLRGALKSKEMMQRALLDNDPKEAFRQQQAQLFNFLYAREAKKFEKVQKRFNRLVKKYTSRQVSGVAAEYTNYIHEIMQRFGLGVNRTLRDLGTELEQAGYGTLKEFVDQKNGDFGNMALDDRLYDPNFAKPVGQLTTEEFRAVTDALTVLDKAGRDETKVIRAGEKEERAKLVDGMVTQLEEFPLKQYSLKEGILPRVTDLAKKYMTVGIINAETWLNRWDRDNLNGLFNQWLVRPLTAAANREATLGREFSADYKALGTIKDASRRLRSPLTDPLSITREDEVGRPYMDFTRKNVAAMISNAGNEYNWDILARGHNADPDGLKNWLIRNSTKEDWVRAEKLGKIFNKAFEMAQTVYRGIYGVAPPKIELTPVHIEWPNGDVFDSPGWYHPIIRDPRRTNLVRNARGEDLMEKDKGLFPSIANGYTKRRTGAVDVLSLDYDMIVPRLNQVLHDIAFRSEVIEAAKLVKDKNLRKAVRQYYGDQYVPMLDNWLSDIAGASNIQYGLMGDITRASNFVRSNVIGTLIGFNPGTVLKHGPTALVNSMYEVGLRNFASAFKETSLSHFRGAVDQLFGGDEEIAQRAHDFIREHSEEIRRRDRNWQESIGGAHKIVEGKTTWRDRVIQWGSKPVAMSDMLSAEPTWLAAYMKEYEESGNHGNAVFAGERAVRRAHGSTAITNLPELVRRSGPFGSWLTSLYGFFSTQMQRRAELAFMVNDTFKLGRQGEIKSAASNVPKIAALAFATLIWPTIIEEYVNSIGAEDHRGPLQRLLYASLGGLASSFLYFRDFTHGVTTSDQPSIGLATTAAADFVKPFHDMKLGTHMFDKAHAGRTVQDFITAFGVTTGMAPSQIGKVLRFGIGYAGGTERPKGPADVGVGLMRGTARRRIER